MEKKYELLKDDIINVKGHTLYRIKALRDFNDIKKGDLGGYIEKEDNLSHENDCWVYHNARVYGDAIVSGNAKISGNAEICGHAVIFGNAGIFNNASIYGKARISGNAIVYGNAKISGNTIVSGNAKISGNAEVRNYAMVSGIVSDNAKVFGNAKVYGNAEVFDNAEVSGNAMVNGDTAIYGRARLSKDAYITNTNEYISIGPIGSRNAITTFYLTKNKTIMVKCGCFNDTIDKFVEQVNETHKNNPIHLNNYMCSIDFAKSFLFR